MKPPFACGFRFDLLGVSPKEPRRDSAQYITAQQGVGQTVATGCEFGTTLESPEKLALRSHVVHRNFIGQNVRSCCFLLDVLEICSNEKLSQVLYPKSKVSIMYFSHVPADVIGKFSVFKRFPNVFCWFFFGLKKGIHWEPFRLDAGRGALGRFVPPIGMGFTHGPERARCILSHERWGLTESCWDRCAVKNDSMLGGFFQRRTYVPMLS